MIGTFAVVVMLLAAVSPRATKLELPSELQVGAGALLLLLLIVGVFVTDPDWLLVLELVAGVLSAIVLHPRQQGGKGDA